MYLGVDESGQGAVLGPLVIGFCEVDDQSRSKIYGNGIDDSKKIPPDKRENLRDLIVEHCKYEIGIISSAEIDSMSLHKRKNQRIRTIIGKFSKKIMNPQVIIDAYGKPEWIEFAVSRNDQFSQNEIIAETKADENYLSVSCASILAKVRRDEIMSEICDKYGVNISGYPNEPTRNFLRNYYKIHGEFPPETRLSWNTVDKIKKEVKND